MSDILVTVGVGIVGLGIFGIGFVLAVCSAAREDDDCGAERDAGIRILCRECGRDLGGDPKGSPHMTSLCWHCYYHAQHCGTDASRAGREAQPQSQISDLKSQIFYS